MLKTRVIATGYMAEECLALLAGKEQLTREKPEASTGRRKAARKSGGYEARCGRIVCVSEKGRCSGSFSIIRMSAAATCPQLPLLELSSTTVLAGA